MLLHILLFAIISCSPLLAEDTSRSERATLISLRTQEYNERLKSLYASKITEWNTEFLANRADAVNASAKSLADTASFIRDRRKADWSKVAADENFVSAKRAAARTILDADAIRGALTGWAKHVERDTRDEMTRYFRQIVAEDLGLRFDEKLRGKAVAAVTAIPLEALVGDGASIEAIEKAINAGMPGVTLGDKERETVRHAAVTLAAWGSRVALAEFGVPELELLTTRATTNFAGRASDWLTEGLDRLINGEPDPKKLAAPLTKAIGAWNEQNLNPRLEDALKEFRGRILLFLKEEAKRLNATMG